MALRGPSGSLKRALFGRMNVEVDEGRIYLKEEEGERMKPSGQVTGKGAVEGAENGPVLYPPAIDEGLHQAAIRTRVGRAREHYLALESSSR